MKLAGVGIDILKMTRIRRFVRQHSSQRLCRLLSPSEQKRFGRKKISPQILAKIFTAKEAFFKTLNRPWMGLEGFQAMSVRFKKAGTFEIVMEAPQAGLQAQGSFFRAGNLCGAQVICWDVD